MNINELATLHKWTATHKVNRGDVCGDIGATFYVDTSRLNVNSHVVIGNQIKLIAH